MKKNDLLLGALLLALTFGMHYLPSILALGYENRVAAAKAWQYVNGGVGMSVVLCCVGILARQPLVWPVLFWGIAESSEQAICRLARPIGGEPPFAPPFSGLCGTDFYWLGIAAALILAVALLDRLRERYGIQH